MSNRKLTHRTKEAATAEREALAIAIAAVQEAQADHGALVRAQSEIDAAKSKARSKVAEAQTALDEARVGASQALRARVMGQKVKKAPSPTEARAALTEAEEAYEAARSASDGLGPELEKAQQTLSIRESRLVSAISAVMQSAPEVRQFVEGTIELQKELISRRLVLRFLTRTGAIPEDLRASNPDRNWRLPTSVSVVNVVQQFAMAPHFWADEKHWYPDAQMARWNDAHERLKLDASASLPGDK